jgi:hypothetical protein
MIVRYSNRNSFYKRLKLVFSWLVICCLGGVLLWGMYGEIAIWIKHSYTIGRVIIKRRNNHFEPVIDYTYSVEGAQYESSLVWNHKANIGDCYIVKYAVYAPYGNKLYYEYPVPDSVQQDHGMKWKRFMHAILLY